MFYTIIHSTCHYIVNEWFSVQVTLADYFTFQLSHGVTNGESKNKIKKINKNAPSTTTPDVCKYKAIYTDSNGKINFNNMMKK